MEIIWRLVFLVVNVIFFLIRSPNGSKRSNPHEEAEICAESLNLAMEREGKFNMTLRSILSIIMLLSIIAYVIYPSRLLNFALPFPVWLRLAGLGIALSALPLLNWAHRALGRQYSPNLELKEDHELITSGPYQYVRHPMYTILIIFMLGVSVLSANAVVLVPHILAILLILLRLGKEETMLIQEFGDKYRDYIANTGRLLPKLN